MVQMIVCGPSAGATFPQIELRDDSLKSCSTIHRVTGSGRSSRVIDCDLRWSLSVLHCASCAASSLGYARTIELSVAARCGSCAALAAANTRHVDAKYVCCDARRKKNFWSGCDSFFVHTAAEDVAAPMADAYSGHDASMALGLPEICQSALFIWQASNVRRRKLPHILRSVATRRGQARRRSHQRLVFGIAFEQTP